MKNKLDDYRQEINQIDEELHILYKKRLAVSRKVGKYKKDHNLPILDEKREQVIFANLEKKFHDDIDLNAFLDLQETMMRVSRNAQHTLSCRTYNVIDSFTKNCCVGFQGDFGSFSSIATQSLFPKHEKKAFKTFSSVFEAVECGEIFYGVVPLENSTHGEVVEVFDLIRDTNVTVVAEIIQPIEHYLLGIEGAKREDIREVYSHPQALAQTRDYFQLHKDMNLNVSLNTATSAKMVAEKGEKVNAAIASKEAATEYGLTILDAHIENFKNNQTRFIVITNKEQILANAKKTTVLVTVDHESGTLAQVVAQFRYEKINMLKITSRPIPNTTWRYQFFIDFEGTICDEKIQQIVQRLQAEVYEVRMLGSYPIYETN